MPIERHGTDFSTILEENENTGPRTISAESDEMVKTFNSTLDAYEALLPAINSDLAAVGYPDHKLEKIVISPKRARNVEVSLTYKKTPPVITLPPPTVLPADEIEYDGGTEQRHIGAHPDYKKQWLGFPKSKNPKWVDSTAHTDPDVNGQPKLVDDPLGTPSVDLVDAAGAPIKYNASGVIDAGGVATKPGVTHYLIPTIIFRRKHCVASGPAVGVTSTDLGLLDEPPGETGVNRWHKGGFKARKNKAQNYWEISEEWTFNPLGTWDTDIYDHT